MKRKELLRMIVKDYECEIQLINEPVSYTHLDVYKRQAYRCPQQYLFSLAGPVIAYGTLAAFIYGIICYCFKLY